MQLLIQIIMRYARAIISNNTDYKLNPLH
jgi:hypothetical protein